MACSVSEDVFGVPDQRLGEEVGAFIVLKPIQSATAEEIQSFCRGQISHQKVPRYIRFVPEFPMTPIIQPTRCNCMGVKRIGRIGPISKIGNGYPADTA